MDTKFITRINNVDIVSTSNEQMVPIRPICEALGIAYQPQYQKIQEDEDLAPTVTLSITVGADGKDREMVCLPVEFIFGWLFTINPKNVKPEAKEAVRKYRMECYRALYNHFVGCMTKANEQNKIEIKLLEEIDILNEQCAEHKNQLAELKHQVSDKRKLLEKVRTERLSNEPTLFG